MPETDRASSDGLWIGRLPQHLREPGEDQDADRQQNHPAPGGIGMLGDDLSQERSRHRQQLHECQRQKDADERREPRPEIDQERHRKDQGHEDEPDERLRELEDQQLASMKRRGKQEIDFRRAEVQGLFSRRGENEQQADQRSRPIGRYGLGQAAKIAPPAGFA